MNKNRYRLIFNPARGVVMPVSETAASHSNAPSRSKANTTAGPARTAPIGLVAVFRPLTFSLLAALGMVSLLNPAALAQIVADPAAPGNQQPTIVPAANGVPVVNIQTPSAAGVSRNLYSQFDVSSAGVILNNASTNTATQLGGWIQGNPYLAGGSARVILNEVNSLHPSQLLGYIEVGGSRAQVVIANPAGITCDGCGFINASRATLTTGTPLLTGGNLDGYRVQQGVITVSGAGLDASQSDYTDLIARAVVVNAGIWAQQLSVTAGANQVDAAAPQSAPISATLATPIVGSGAAPAVAIDVAALGGMYAGKIILVSTEAGVGVANAGQIGASAGDVLVTADGRLQNSGQITSTGNITTTTGGLGNSGSLYAQGHAALTSVTDIDNTGVIAAAADLALNANSINNRSALLNAGGTLSIQTHTLDNSNTQGLNQGIQAGTVSLRADQIDNTQGLIRADTTLTLTSSGSLNNTQGLITAGLALTLADADLSAKTLTITNTQGTLLAGQNLHVDAASLTGDGSVLSSGDISVTLASDFIHSGKILANGNLVFATSGTLTNQAAMQAGNALTVSAANIDNTAGAEFSATTTTLTTSGLLTNRGLIDGSATRLSAHTLNNLGSGQIYGDHLTIAATALNNTPENGAAPVIAARTRLDLGVQTLSNQNGALIFSAGDMAIGGALDANHQATGEAALVLNNGAVIEALGALTIHALDLQNRNANLVTQQTVDPTNYQESVQPRGSSTTYALATCSGIGGGQDKNTCAGYPGNFEDYTWLKVTATPSHTEVLATQPGQILAGGDLLVVGGSVTNQDSHILAGGLLDFSGSTLANLAIQGQDITTYNGTAQFTHVESCGTFGSSHCRRWDGVAAYNPAPTYGTPYNLPTTQLVQLTAPTGSGIVIATTSTASVIGAPAPVTLPNNALFHPSASPTAGYLVETDPRFANYRTWLSSDYLLGQLGMDPAYMQKRLGDGFYEQRLVREQVAQLTGRRFLTGYANDEAQYQALMNAGLTYADEWELIPGVALSAAQVAALTSDIVWLVTTEVTLPDATTQSVLTPQVYVRVQPGDLDGSGSLLSGATVNLQLTGDVVNSGSVAGRDLVNLAAGNLHNLGGYIGGRDVALTAQQDLNNLGGSIVAVDSLVALAGRDLNVTTTTRDSESQAGLGSFTRTGIERVAGLYVTGPAGVLIASAGRDITLTAAQITNSGVGGQTLIDAGNNLTLATVTTAQQDNIVWDDKNHLKQGSTTEVGTTIQTQGDLTLNAGVDLNARAAQIASTAGAIQASAGRDLTITSGEASQNWSEARHSVKEGLLATTTRTSLDSVNDTLAVASIFSAVTVDLEAGRDLTLVGSQTVSDTTTRLAAGNDVVIGAATETHSETHYSLKEKQATGLGTALGAGAMLTGTPMGTMGGAEMMGSTRKLSEAQGERASGFASTVSAGSLAISSAADTRILGATLVADANIDINAGGDLVVQDSRNTQSSQAHSETSHSGMVGTVWQPAIGKVSEAQDGEITQQDSVGSQIASLGGDISFNAGLTYTQTGSAVLAPGGDVAITAQNITILASQDTAQSKQQSRSSKTALGGEVKVPLVDALRAINDLAQSARQTGDARMQGLAAITALSQAATAYQNAQALSQGDLTGIKVSVSLGTQSSTQTTTQTSAMAVASTLLAGGDLHLSATLPATGAQVTNAGDITVVSSTLVAGNNMTLQADDAILLLAGQSSTTQHSTSKSSSASIGIGFALGGAQNGFTLDLAAAGSRGKADGEDVIYTNTHIEAGKLLALESGSDTTLRGAVATANQVIATVGGSLAIESLQDTSQYDSKQQSVGASISICVPPFCYGATTGSVSAAQSKVNGDFASVTEQSGIKAGDDGFQVTVQGNTDLKGAVIASSEQAVRDGKNSLTTGTLTTNEIQNKADASANSGGIALNSDMLTQGKYGAAKAVVGNALNNGEASESSSGQTLSAVSAGTVTILDEEKQRQLTGKIADETVANLNRDTANAQTAAERLDVKEMEQAAQAAQAIKQAVFKEAVKFTDESYRKIFLVKHPMFEHLRGEDGKLMFDEKGKPVTRELSDNEKQSLKPGPDGKISIANNGIFNDVDAAAKYASQHSTTDGPQYLIYFPEANNIVSELLIAGYQKFLENDFWGLSNSTQETKNMMNQYGQGNLHFDGHSRGAMTIGNALESVQNQPDAQGALSGTTVNFYGAAYNAEKADSILSDLQNRDAITDFSNLNGMVIQTQTHQADPVGRAIGGNPATGGTIPEGSNIAKEVVNALGGENTVHNCYGESDAIECSNFWNGGFPTLKPVR